MRSAIALVILTALAGCATSPSAPPETIAEPAAEQETVVSVPPPEPEFVPAVFVGLTAAEVESRYGAPALKRRDGIAQVWQYHAGDCVLHLFFYGEPDANEQDGFRVEHVAAELRQNGQAGGVTAEQACAGPFGVIREAEHVVEPEQDSP